MVEMAAASLAKLRELLITQQQLLAQFLRITQDQEKLLLEGNEDALSHSLEQRRQLLNQVEELLQKLTPLWQTYAASPDLAPDLADLQDDIGKLLRQANELDQKNRLVLSDHLDVLRAQMRRVSATRRGAETYIKGAELFTAEYVDQRQ